MPHVPRAVCARCNREMHCVQMGQRVSALLAGEKKEPYYHVNADRFQCEVCQGEVWVGFSDGLVLNFEDGFGASHAERRFHFKNDYPEDAHGYYEPIMRSLWDSYHRIRRWIDRHPA